MVLATTKLVEQMNYRIDELLQSENITKELKLFLSSLKPVFDQIEKDSMLFQQMDMKINSLQNEIDTLNRNMLKLDEKTNKPSPYIQSILNKIDILKNIIKEVNQITDDSNNILFSPTLAEVQEIEDDIRKKGTVTRKQLDRLNIIYDAQIKLQNS